MIKYSIVILLINEKNGAKMNRIHQIEKDSIAEEMDIEVGDVLISINGVEVVDIIDYMYLTQDDFLEVEIEKASGEVWELEIEKDYDEDLGLAFENPIMDKARRCSNKCVFCFIDQLPKGMRETLYFKDDDSRLSFLQGNFVTLTNLKDSDLERIVKYRISPINVSVHTTDPKLRVTMLGNRFAGNIMARLKTLVEGGIVVNAQIVLCPGYNDGEALLKTLKDLITLAPNLNSVAVVPIGLTRHREGLLNMQAVDERVAITTLQIIHDFQDRALKEIGTRFVFAADEIYLQAKMPFPEHHAYEGYLQFEDGIGMIRKLSYEFERALKHAPKQGISKRRVLIPTGTAAASFLEDMAQALMAIFPQVTVDVLPVVNAFFGERITVVGLLTGQDIISAVKDASEYDAVLLSEAIFRSGEDILLDDITLDLLSQTIKAPVYKVSIEGESLLKHILIGGSNE